MPIRRIDKTLTATTATIAGEDIAASSIPVKPHIQYGMLQPAVAGKLLDGTTSHSGAYGTAQSDGHSYYYTDIKGSKPIKDPRIGGYFGSQRYPCKSVQLLEQETATHGEKVFSIDGREWMRVVGSRPTTMNNAHGQYCHVGNTGGDLKFVEIVGYFNQANWGSYANSHATRIITETVVNGGSAHTTDTSFVTTIATPLASRYVDAASIIKIEMETITSPQITTLKLVPVTNGYIDLYSIELIAQDTTSTANRSKIQIPSQNVVSYGKKFTVSGTPHYDPFNGMSGAKTLAQLGDYIDTATSLGMENWKGGTSNYYKPFNGGRVVKWVDSSGTIKTSVTMMPPNAQNVGGTASNAFSDGEVQAGTNDHTITFNTSAVDQSLSEVAKTFHYREFGNGAANGGASGTYADASMFTHGGDNIAYVMDDGLTTFSGEDVRENGQLYHHNTTGIYLTWIGTGLSYHSNTGFGAPNTTWVQNLPYGTHILKIEAYAAYAGTNGEDHKLSLDGVVIANPLTVTHADNGVPYLGHPEFTFHQPKKPPIPEDACIIADYMLMADYVGVPSSDSGQHSTIPKGTRMCNASRDIFYNTASGSLAISNNAIGNRERTLRVQFQDTTVNSKEGPLITYFGHPKMSYGIATDSDSSARYELKISNSTTNVTGVTTSGSISGADITGFKSDGASYQHISSSKSDGTLGFNTAKLSSYPADTNDDYFYFGDAYIPTPIHTSSHYQTFETPFHKELVGGDRNMEQTNLVVTSDGKSWDEVTRDTSYIGNVLVTTNWASQNNTNTTVGVGDEVRGYEDGKHLFYKDFALAYNRFICLVDGHYQIIFGNHMNADSGAHYQKIRINGTAVRQVYYEGSGNSFIHGQLSIPLKRGDYVDHQGMHFTDDTFQFQINRLS